MVLSKIQPNHASRVLGALPESLAMEVVMRMLRMESVQREVLDEIEMTLRTEFMANLSATNQTASHEMMRLYRAARMRGSSKVMSPTQ